MHSTTLVNLVVDKGETMIQYQQMGLENPKWVQPKFIWIFGEAGVVKNGKKR